jgi:hypothetical protein
MAFSVESDRPREENSVIHRQIKISGRHVAPLIDKRGVIDARRGT